MHSKDSQPEKRDLVDLWKHSFLWRVRTNSFEKDAHGKPQKVFTISLLHDIGKTVMYMGVENYHAILDEAIQKGKETRYYRKGGLV